MLNIKTDLKGEAIAISLEGLLDSQTNPKLNAVLEENLGKVREVVFDLANLEYLTSAGLRSILKAQQAMEKKNGVMTVRNVPKDIMAIFDSTGFSVLLNIE